MSRDRASVDEAPNGNGRARDGDENDRNADRRGGGGVIGALARALTRTRTNVARVDDDDDGKDEPTERIAMVPLALQRARSTRERAMDTTVTKLDEDAVRRAVEAKEASEMLEEIAQERVKEDAAAASSDEDEEDEGFANKREEEEREKPVFSWSATLQRRVEEIEGESEPQTGEGSMKRQQSVGARSVKRQATVAKSDVVEAERGEDEGDMDFSEFKKMPYRNGVPTAALRQLSRINTINAPTNAGGMLQPSISTKQKKNIEEDSYYEAVMSDRIPAYKKPKRYIARLHNLETAILDKEGKQLSVIKSTSRDIDVLGPGIGLWFSQLKTLSRFFLFLTILSALAIAHYVYVSSKTDLSVSEEVKTTLGVTSAGLLSKAYGIDIRTIMAFVTSVDAFAVLMFMAMIAIMSRRMRAYVIRVDEALLTLADFSLQVSGLPIDSTEDEVRAHFEEVGSIADVVICRSYGAVLRLRIRRSKLFKAAEELKFELSAIRHKCKKRGVNAQDDRTYRRVWTQFESTRDKIIELKAQIDQRMTERFQIVYAFVTFEQESDKLTCREEYAPYFSFFRPERTKFRLVKNARGRTKSYTYLKVKEAVEASDILWENMKNQSWAQWFFRRFATALAIIFLLAANIILVVLVTSQVNSRGRLLVDCTEIYDSGNQYLYCPAVWPITASMSSDDVVAISNKNYRDQVGVTDCSGFIESTIWSANVTKYAPYSDATTAYAGLTEAQALAQGFDAYGVWQGGLDGKTFADECAAKVCYECLCQTDVLSGSISAICLDYYKEQLIIYSLEVGRLAVVAFTSILLLYSAAKFALFERHKTVSDTERTTSRFAFFTLTTNALLIPLLVNVNIIGLTGFPILFQGSYDDTTIDWYQVVMKSLMISAFINACWFGPSRLVLSWFNQFFRYVRGGSCSTQYKLNQMYERPKFTLAERYGQMMTVIFTAIVLSSAAPILIPTTSLYLFLAYWSDKVLLLRYARYPSLYDHKLAKQFLWYAPLACIAHFAFGFWTFSQWDVPTYFIESLTSWNPQDISDQQKTTFWEIRANMTKYEQLDIEARFYRVNGLIQLAPLMAYTLYLLVKTLFLTIGSTLLLLLGCSHILKGDWSATVQYHRFTAARNKLLNEESFDDDALAGLPSYRVQDNPEYASLFPEAKKLEKLGAQVGKAGESFDMSEFLDFE